jgi:hypothetical protein
MGAKLTIRTLERLIELDRLSRRTRYDGAWQEYMALLWSDGLMSELFRHARRSLLADIICGECGGAITFVERTDIATIYRCEGCGVQVSKIRSNGEGGVT